MTVNTGKCLHRSQAAPLTLLQRLHMTCRAQPHIPLCACVAGMRPPRASMLALLAAGCGSTAHPAPPPPSLGSLPAHATCRSCSSWWACTAGTGCCWPAAWRSTWLRTSALQTPSCSECSMGQGGAGQGGGAMSDGGAGRRIREGQEGREGRGGQGGGEADPEGRTTLGLSGSGTDRPVMCLVSPSFVRPLTASRQPLSCSI